MMATERSEGDIMSHGENRLRDAKGREADLSRSAPLRLIRPTGNTYSVDLASGQVRQHCATLFNGAPSRPIRSGSRLWKLVIRQAIEAQYRKGVPDCGL